MANREETKIEAEDPRSTEVSDEKKEEGKKSDGASILDLAFAMDCTGSMGSYIQQARQVTTENILHYRANISTCSLV